MGRLGAAVAAFALAVGVGAHALDELSGRPLRTAIPDAVLVALASVSIAVACAIGSSAPRRSSPGSPCSCRSGSSSSSPTTSSSPTGASHSDLWFGVAWGGFPLVCGYAAVAGELDVAAGLAAGFAVLLSLAQRALSTHVRFVRRQVTAAQGELELADGTREEIDAGRLIAPAEHGLRLLTAATVVLAAAMIVARL